MIKVPSRSLHEVQLSNLPPLTKKLGLLQATNKINQAQPRHPYLIRKKIASFIDQQTNRKQITPASSGQISRLDKPINESRNLSPKQKKIMTTNVTSNINKLPDCKHAVDIANYYKMKSKLNTEPNAENLKVDTRDLIQNRSQLLRKKMQKLIDQDHSDEVEKTVIKSIKRKRKIEVCKTRKINWRSSKNTSNMSNLGISEIMVNGEPDDTPIQSLKDLYLQIF